MFTGQQCFSFDGNDGKKKIYSVTFTAVVTGDAASRQIYPIFYEAGAIIGAAAKKVFY